jgi:hypothetical protein
MILLKRANSDLRERRRARTTCERRMTTRATSRELHVNQTCCARRESCDSDGVLHMVRTSTSTIWLYTSGRIFTSQAVRLENRL